MTSKYFEPTPGYFRKEEAYGGWEIVGSNGVVGVVPVLPTKRLWHTECDAMMMAGSPEMLETLVRVHNELNATESARRIQGSIRGCLVKVLGDSERIHHMRDYRLIMPPEVKNGQ